MTSTYDAAAIIAKMLDANEAVRALWRERFDERIAPHVAVLREAMLITGRPAVPAALEYLQTSHEILKIEDRQMSTMLVLAALVEVVKQDGGAE